MKQISIFSLLVRKCTICSSPLNKKQILYCSQACTDKAQYLRKRNFINTFKTECSVCGYNGCKDALVFHHLDNNKKDFELGDALEKSYEKIEDEIKKCILLCSNCHAELHAKERELEFYKE